MKKIIKIEGMSCMNCVNHVKNAIEEISGIKTVTIDLQGKNAVVELSQDVSDSILKEAVEEAGYDVVEIKSI
ncbi:heavy-metal-associated domain-containing protein [Crassaminicella thermophila]|uniref:Heavy-metal-associated domain-containing protein n=1 Tax=Crassaminicella thermophila TaxID=2599308 RepID=A0A5C0SK36_CRATE|nr:heavy metal-associated domain-containing protein [Crassaminicella thermophila]QEK13309.1 heavy-metal-associated domain-containing protein [Crassaminicella thermophila]